MSDPNDLTENQVVDSVASWLTGIGFRLSEPVKHGRQRGDDIAAASKDGRLVFVECKGSISQAGNQLKDWDYSAMAVFGALKETEEKRPEDLHAIAVPSTARYKMTLGPLEPFLERQKIALFWVHADGRVVVGGATNGLFVTDRA